MNVSVIGTGNIGGALGRAFARAGYAVVFGARALVAGAAAGDTGPRVATVGEAVAAADVVLVAVPGSVVESFVREHGAALAGKLVLDASNRIGGPGPAHSAASYAEHAPGARYARVFNSLGVENLNEPNFDGTPADMFFSCARRDRPVVEGLVAAVGLRPVYVGEEQHDVVDGVLRLWFALAIGQKQGRHLAFRVLTPSGP